MTKRIIVLCFAFLLILPMTAFSETKYSVNNRPLTEMSIEELYELEDAIVNALNDVFALRSKESSGEIIGVYVINPRTKKFHFPDCYSALQIGQDRRFELCSPSELLGKGFKPCGQCKPASIHKI